MAAEFDQHLTEDRAANEGKNHRNGGSRKRVLAGDGHVEVTIPRDREARFETVLIGKYQRRLPDFDDKVISMYARGMSTREIPGHLEMPSKASTALCARPFAAVDTSPAMTQR